MTEKHNILHLKTFVKKNPGVNCGLYQVWGFCMGREWGQDMPYPHRHTGKCIYRHTQKHRYTHIHPTLMYLNIDRH